MRYEDLTSDPEKESRRICDFLGVEWEPGMLRYGGADGGDKGDAGYRKGLGDWKDKIRSGAVQPGRELPSPEAVPATLRDIATSWGYLPETVR